MIDLCGFQSEGLIILNSVFSGQLLDVLWQNTRRRVCADGGANRVFDLRRYTPDAVVGDLDSIRSDVTDFYADRIFRVADQDRNDLDKAIDYLRDAKSIAILGAFRGRFDQVMATFDAMHRWNEISMRLYGDENVATLLAPGIHTIRVRAGIEGPHCGLVPIGAPCVVSTEGLEWNLNNQRLEFGHLVSTSNLIRSDTVTVRTSHPLVWTTEFHLDRLPTSLG
ncbi:hypothetical protein CTAYLR_002103 [Chrysophaeum taylorii]|uniref:Thiamin pyrophosphokinase thiamin-binding domain-containing protein n=1 Tax=Chrysophaeum taylorii TaxID=2483200 RepID=A0AAD7UP13_9STRA|nr:hypothetical protein CTAYLR_002103 [Chrysophaeum taylorii]